MRGVCVRRDVVVVIVRMLIIFTGNGKGKTTAALGQAMRAVGEGKRAIVHQFIKGPWISGEDKIAPIFGDKLTIIKGGKGFVGILGDSLPITEHQRAAQETWEHIKEAVRSGEYYLVVADEFNVALSLQLLNKQDVLADIILLKKELEERDALLVLTGRGADRDIIALADLVTEMREVKHPYNSGTKARRGVEF